MPNKILAIATVGRCGSSFLAACFKKLGMDPGDKWKSSVNAGYESVGYVNNKIREATTSMPIEGEQAKNLAKQFKERMIKDSKPFKVIKDPRFSVTLPVWIEAGLIRKVIVLQRDLVKNVVHSTTKSKAGLGKDLETVLKIHGHLMWTLHAYSIEHEVFVFPRFLYQGHERTRMISLLSEETNTDPFKVATVFRDTVNLKLLSTSREEK